MARQKAKSTRPRSKAEILDLIIAVVGVSEDPPTSLQLWDALRGHLSLGRDRFMSLLWELHEQGILQAFDPEDASARSRKPVSSEARLRTDLEWEARVGLKECAAVEEKAERIASSMTRVPKAEQILERQTEILRYLSDGEPTSVTSLMEQLGWSGPNDRRKLQRDLLDMQRKGQAVRTADDKWKAEREKVSEKVASMALATAMDLLEQVYGDLVPDGIQASLRTVKERALKLANTLPMDDPRVRWMKAMRIASMTHPLDQQVIRPGVREGIEDAIVQQRKVRLTRHRWNSYLRSESRETQDGEVVTVGVGGRESFVSKGSISHVLLYLPGQARIDFWDDEREGGERIGLDEIDQVEILEEAAAWRRGYEPALTEPSELRIWPDDDEGPGVVARLTAEAFDHFSDRKISRHWHVVTEHDNGDVTVSIDTTADVPLDKFLKQPGVVTVRPEMLFMSRLGGLRADRQLLDRAHPEYLHYQKEHEDKLAAKRG